MWQAKLKETLRELSKHYVTGCVGHYSVMSPNPWQVEHDVLEAMLKIGSDLEIKKSIEAFEKNCKALIADFKK